MNQPKSGIHISSRLTMKVKSSNSLSSAKVSKVDWCLAAMISGSLSRLPPRCSNPRISNLVPHTTRSRNTLTRPHSSAILRIARCGMTSVASATSSSTTRFR
jgi:hypothetical protein